MALDICSRSPDTQGASIRLVSEKDKLKLSPETKTNRSASSVVQSTCERPQVFTAVDYSSQLQIVFYPMAEALPLTNITMAHPDNELSLVMCQNGYASYHMIYYLLNEEGIRLNGYVNGNGHATHTINQLTRDPNFREAIRTLESSCRQMRTQHQREIDGLVNTLDISDTQLYANFLDSANSLMDSDIRWGRIAVLFFFSGVLAKRLYREGQTPMIESLIGWLRSFLNERIATWILEKGGWGAIRDAVNVEPPHKPPVVESQQQTSSWFTLAAVGVGAVIVGALAIR